MDDVVEVRARARVTFASGNRTDFAACQVRAAPEGLFLDGRRHVDEHDLLHGTVEGRGQDAHLVLTCQHQSVFDVGPLDRDVARAMLTALRLDASHRATTYRRRSALPIVITAALAAPTLAGVVLLETLQPEVRSGLGIVAATLLILFVLLRPVLHTRIQVGADALTVRRFGTRTRRLPYPSIQAVRTEMDTVVVEPRHGPPLVVPGPLHHEGNGPRLDETSDTHGLRMAVECVERVEHAMAQAAPAAVELQLARADRGIEGWVAALRAMGTRQTFRDQAMPESRLWDLVLSAPEPITRAAAAVALGPTLDEDGKARLRVAAQAVVTPKLRVALEAAAEGREEAIEHALLELEAATRKGRAA